MFKEELFHPGPAFTDASIRKLFGPGVRVEQAAVKWLNQYLTTYGYNYTRDTLMMGQYQDV